MCWSKRQKRLKRGWTKRRKEITVADRTVSEGYEVQRVLVEDANTHTQTDTHTHAKTNSYYRLSSAREVEPANYCHDDHI